MVYTRCCQNDIASVLFTGLRSPPRANADGIHTCILEVLETIQIGEVELANKLISLGCDGAAVTMDKANGVAAQLRKLQPLLLTIHCFAHRLELACKDTTKECDLYTKSMTMLMGLYYFYKRSALQRQTLVECFHVLGQNVCIPTRIGGTR